MFHTIDIDYSHTSPAAYRNEFFHYIVGVSLNWNSRDHTQRVETKTQKSVCRHQYHNRKHVTLTTIANLFIFGKT